MQWKLFVSSSISRMTLGFHVFEAIGVWQGRDLEGAKAVSRVREMDWLMITHQVRSPSLLAFVSVDEMVVFGRLICDVPKLC